MEIVRHILQQIKKILPMEFSVQIVLVVALGALYLWLRRKKFHLPPGPWGLPLVGYLPFLGKHPHETFKTLSEKYGKIFSVRMGRDLAVILNDITAMKDAFNNPAILDRPSEAFDFPPDGMGFAGQNGAEWIEQRRHVMKLLKDIGMGTNPWESDLEAEIDDFLKILEDSHGEPVCISEELSTSVSNNMMTIVLGRRLGMSDPGRGIVNKGVEGLINTFTPTGLVASFTKAVKFLSELGLVSMAAEYKKLKDFNGFIRKEMEKRKVLANHELKEESFIDGYLMEIRSLKEKNLKSFFKERNLVGTAQTLVVAGTDTSKTALIWMFLLAAVNPGVQKKVQEEIDRALGRDGKLKWMQRGKLPYTYATTQEALRWSNVAPLGAAHRANEDTKIGDYDIPKGTFVFANMYAIHMDPAYWKNPERFQPERFLDKDGNLIMNRQESYVPFSLGRRSCPGEVIAMMEVFHYFTSILQKFHIRGDRESEIELEGVEGATFQPAPQKLRFILRD